MMNDKQRAIFSEILDLNFDYDREKDPVKKWDLATKLGDKKKELKDDMGEEAYNTFMERGKQMFAPKKG